MSEGRNGFETREQPKAEGGTQPPSSMAFDALTGQRRADPATDLEALSSLRDASTLSSNNFSVVMNGGRISLSDEILTQIARHDRKDREESLLASVFDTLWRSDENSRKGLETLYEQTSRAEAAGDPAINENAAARRIRSALFRDQETLDNQETVSLYGTGFVKTASLFMMGGKSKGARNVLTSPWIGRTAVAMSFGLDQARVGDSIGEQSIDFTLGAGKGLALRGVMGQMGKFNLTAPGQGMVLGTSSRFLEHTINRRTYLDEATGSVDLRGGAEKIAAGTFSGGGLVSDAALFWGAHALSGRMSTMTGGLLERSPLLKTVSVSSSFGFSNGVARQLQTEWNNGLPRDFQALRTATGNVLHSGLTHAFIDGVAGIPGGLQNRSLYRSNLEYERARTAQRQQTLGGELVRPTERTSVRTADEAGGPQQIVDFLARAGDGRMNARDLPISPEHVRTNAAPLEYSPGTEPIFRAREGNGARPTEAATQADFQVQNLDLVDTPVRIYRSPRTTAEIVVTERYAQELDTVRDLRRRAGENGPGSQAAREELERNPLKDRALPEEVMLMVEALPDQSIVRKVVISGEENPFDPFFQQRHGPGFKSAADTTSDGEITLYRRNLDGLLHEDIAHEWSHSVRDQMRALRALFDIGAGLEQNGHMAREYARPVEENWSVHFGEELLSVSGSRFWHMAHNAPIRAAILGRALAERLALVPEGSRSPFHEIYAERARLLETDIMPLAKAKLAELAGSGDAGTASNAARLLVMLSTPAEAGALRLTRVDLTGMPVTDATLPTVAAIPTMTDLSLASTGVTGSGMFSLARSPLETLNLSSTRLTSSGLDPISRISTLTDLDISGTKVNDAAVTPLSRMANHLARLNVRGTNITPAARARLAQALPNTRIEY